MPSPPAVGTEVNKQALTIAGFISTKTKSRGESKDCGRCSTTDHGLPGITLPRISAGHRDSAQGALRRSRLAVRRQVRRFRALCYVERGHCRLVARNGNEFSWFATLVAGIAAMLAVDDALLDGEMIALDPTGRSSATCFGPPQHPPMSRLICSGSTVPTCARCR
jgi:hypothetical protein